VNLLDWYGVREIQTISALSYEEGNTDLTTEFDPPEYNHQESINCILTDSNPKNM